MSKSSKHELQVKCKSLPLQSDAGKTFLETRVLNMATKKSKKVVGKDDLRRLMKETRGSIKKEAKKIDSPLVKYPLVHLRLPV